jgi:hypothetical protein
MKKSLFLVITLLIGAMNHVFLYADDIEVTINAPSCIDENGSFAASYNVTGGTISDIQWDALGDLSCTSSGIYTSTGIGKGVVRLKYRIGENCRQSVEHEVFKRFYPPQDLEIKGPMCLTPGEVVVFSIDPLLTVNLDERIGMDHYYWNVCDTDIAKNIPYLDSLHYDAGDGSSVTFSVKDWDMSTTQAEIYVYLGDCNNKVAGKKVSLPLTKQAPKPIPEKEEYCIPYGTDMFTLALLESYPTVSYSWKTPIGWNIVEANQDSTWVRVKPHESTPCEIIVSAAYKNGDGADCAIAQTAIKINRRWSNNPSITTIGCLTAGQEDSVEFNLKNVPSGTEVDWHFNKSWWDVYKNDTSNTRVFAKPLSNVPLTDTIYVYELAQCEDATYTLKHDSVITYFIPTKVEISGLKCVAENTPYTYSVERKQGEVGPMAQNFEWRIYRKSGSSYAVANQNGATASISFPADVEKLVVTPLSPNSSCNGDTTQYAIMISPTPPASIIWEDNHCIAAGMEDSVTLSVSNAIATQTYTWDYTTQTHNWSLKRFPTDNHSEIVLYTTGQAGWDSVAVFIEGICGNTDTVKIGLETAAVPFSIQIDERASYYDFYSVPGNLLTLPEFEQESSLYYEWKINGESDDDWVGYDATDISLKKSRLSTSDIVSLTVTTTSECKYSYSILIGDAIVPEIQNSINYEPNTNGTNRNIEQDFIVRPNPANSQLSIDLPETSKPSIIKICDMSGKMIKRIKTSESSLTIPTDNLSEAVYVILLYQEGSVLSKQFIVKH